jgi:hypothetical protein
MASSGMLRRNVLPKSPVLVTLMMQALSSYKRRLLQQPRGVTSQKTPFFLKMIITLFVESEGF